MMKNGTNIVKHATACHMSKAHSFKDDFTAALEGNVKKEIKRNVSKLAEKFGFDEDLAITYLNEILIFYSGSPNQQVMASMTSEETNDTADSFDAGNVAISNPIQNQTMNETTGTEDTNGPADQEQYDEWTSQSTSNDYVNSDNLNVYITHLNDILNTTSLTLSALITRANEMGLKRFWTGLKTIEDVRRVFGNNRNFDKGLCGKILEYALFGTLPNSSPEPDLNKDGDIKTNKWEKLKKQSAYRATERMKIGSAGNEDNWSSFDHILQCNNITELKKYDKMKRGIIPIFDRQKNKCSTLEDAMSLRLLYVARYNLDELDYNDILNNDLRSIQDKIRNKNMGGGGEKYLHVHTCGPGRGKNSGRALGYKQKFVTTLVAESIARDKSVSVEAVLCKSERSLYINNAFLK